MKIRSKILYRTLSVYVVIKYFLIRTVALFCSIAAFYHFYDNPIVTSVIGTICLILFLFIGDSELIVYDNKLKYYISSIIARNRTEVTFKDIKMFNVEGAFGLAKDLFTDVAPVYLQDPYNQITIEFQDGTTKQLKTFIYIDKLKNATEIINGQLSNLSQSR